MKSPDIITIKLPIKAEFASIARLSASGIANTLGFDIDTIEDIKVALSEVLSKIIEKNPPSDRVDIDFIFDTEKLSIKAKIPDYDLPVLFSDEEDNFALAIISSLMDEINIDQGDNGAITMVKNIGRAI